MPEVMNAPIGHRARAEYRPRSRAECYATLRGYFDSFAPHRDAWRSRNAYYHAEIARLCRFYVPPGASVLEVGCATGELLAALVPVRGAGVDLSPEMISLARVKFPGLRFEAGAFEDGVLPPEPYDYIVLSDVLGFVFNIQEFFEKLKPYCHARTRLVMHYHSRLWQPLLSLAEATGLKHRQPVLNWVTQEDVANLLGLAGYEVIQTDSRLLLPKYVPLLARGLNRLSALTPLRWFSLTNWTVARLPLPPAGAAGAGEPLSATVVCPCRNEAGNIPNIVARLPRLGAHTELIFVEGHSQDGTYEACVKEKEEHPELDISVYRQEGKGKKDAVWLGFSKAKCDVLLILDADLTVPPEDLPAFFQAVASGRVEFVNGSRLVYPMAGQAMRFLNLLGNKFFSLAFAFLVGQRVKDTLCGTKVLLRRDYERLAAGRAYFGDFDPFGDFDLLYGAAKLGLKIVDLPVRYQDRAYGTTQISRFRHGWRLLKMCGVALARLKLR